MKLTTFALVMVALAGLGCGSPDDAALGAGSPDAVGAGGAAGQVVAPVGAGGAAGADQPAAGGGAGGTPVTMMKNDSGTTTVTPPVKMDAMPPATNPSDTKPAEGPPYAACVAEHGHISASVCLDRNGSQPRAKYNKYNAACNSCVVVAPDGHTIEKQYVGCSPGAGAVCVQDCSECK